MKTIVLMSSYNGEKHIRQQLDSILSQQWGGELDLLVRDDGSTDSTHQILQQYAAEGKLRWYTGENLKPAKSFLDLIARCPDYDYYALADQDDVWYPDKLQSSIRLIENATGPAMSFANARLVDGALSPIGRNVYNRTPHHDFYSVVCGGGILGCTVLFNHALAQLVKAYPKPDKLIMHDSYISILCTLFDGQIFYDPQPHMDYRQHGNNVVGAQWTKWDALKNRLQRITKPQKVSIADMAAGILAQAPQTPNRKKLAFLQKIASYRDSFPKALSLACSRQPHYNSKNMEVTMRLSILFRNR